MKTAISIPDKTFKKAEKAAKRAGMSRSRFYARAIESYSDSVLDDDITEALNRVYENESSKIDPVIMELQLRALPKEDW